MTDDRAMPLCTVIIPAYNAARWIASTLASATAQTLGNIEILVIDDGSTDTTATLVMAAAQQDSRIRLIRQRNAGVSAARNVALRQAGAPYIALLDADDLWSADKLARHVAHLNASPGVGVSFSASRLIDEQDREIGRLAAPTDGRCGARELFCHNPLGNGSTPVVRRAALDAIAFHVDDRLCWFDEALRQSEDVECWVRLAAATEWTFAALDAPLTSYRLTSSGLSADVRRQMATWLEFRRKVQRTLPDLDLRFGNTAEGLQRRYLARKAVRNGEAALARHCVAEAMRLHPVMLWREPKETIFTMLAVLAVSLMPRGLYARLKRDLTTAVRAPLTNGGRP